MGMELQTILESEGLPELIPRFVEHGITEGILVTLTDQDLEKIGVRSLGERRRLLRVFNLKKEASSVLAWVIFKMVQCPKRKGGPFTCLPSAWGDLSQGGVWEGRI